jgi:hypothetical protein
MTYKHRNKDAIYIEPGSPSEKEYCELFNSTQAGKPVHLSKKNNYCSLTGLLPDIWHHAVPDGWFKSLEEVPELAMTITIPALIRVPQIIISVPRKLRLSRECSTSPPRLIA